MESPYKYLLEKLADEGGKEVAIDRDGAPVATGILKRANERGCTLTSPGPDDQSSMHVFIAYEHIRGVTYAALDMDKIGK